MEENMQPRQSYLTVKDAKIPVSREVYQLVRQQNNHIHYIARKEFRCSLPNFAKCSGDCFNCQWQLNGMVESYSSLRQDHLSHMSSKENTEEKAILAITREQIYECADSLITDGALILRLHIEEGWSFRCIAKRLGVSSTIVFKRFKKTINYLQKNKEKFI